MTISLYGQLNLNGLTTPDLYVQIVPPPSILVGTPTNLGGIVGTASWGPVNSPVPFANTTNAAQYFGPPINRLYDMMSAAQAASFQGNVGNYVGVRVTDGTDTAASGTSGNNGYYAFWQAIATAINTGIGTPRGPSNIITATAVYNGLQIAAKYTGALGSQIQVSLAAGAAANSYRYVVVLPGSVPEIFDNLGAVQALDAVPATGYVTFTTNPSAATSITIGGTAVTFVSSGPSGNQVLIAGTLAGTVTNLLSFLQTSTDTNLVKFSYSLIAPGTVNPFTGSSTGSNYVLDLTAVTAGTSGNSLTIATTVAGATASGTTLAGGAASMTLPTLASSTLTGGTDGVAGVTTATLLGVDTLPRTGMYALRATGVSVATLVDVSDSTTWAAQEAFGIGEGVYMITTTPSGDTISNAVAVKKAAGIDTPWVKFMFGDWPSYNDPLNGITNRIISPSAFALGRLVNLSPEQSSLNKPILGVVSTQKSAANLVYSSSDISTLAQNGFDVICNPVPGGNYFGMRTGRNASSQASTHGDNYTRMTDFLASTLENGLGIFVGELQSQQPSDLTRSKIVATVTALLSNLKAPGGNPALAMIDDFQVTDDLTNNSPYSISAGYNFCFIQVRYLSVIEYLVAQLQGGQTVQIVRASTLPSLS